VYGGHYGNPNHYTNLDKIFACTSPPVQGRFWHSFEPWPLTPPPVPRGPETLKADGHIFKTGYKTKDVQQVAN